jgi:acyl carrier protein
MFVEKRFQMTISRDQLRLANFRSIEAIAELVARHRSAAS